MKLLICKDQAPEKIAIIV